MRESDTRKARATVRRWQGIVNRLWPDCPNELARDDTVLVVRAGYAIKHGRLPAPREFGVSPLDRLALEGMRENPRRTAVDRERVFPRERERAVTV